MLTPRNSLVTRIRSLQHQLTGASDASIGDRALDLRFRVQGGVSLNRALPEAFALACEASRRRLSMVPYDVQLHGAIELARGRIIEMETGQGKTLTATLPLFLFSLSGKGAHLATSNDYLAQRDAQQMAPLFDLLKTKVGFISESMDDPMRRNQYSKDVTYANTTELGFDFLRDRLNRKNNARFGAFFNSVMRDLHFVVADEADAVMIDEANTPMIIGAEGRLGDHHRAVTMWAASHARFLSENRHYRYSLRQKKVELTREGRRQLHQLAQQSQLHFGSVLDLYRITETAILVDHDFHRDSHYILRDGEIVLVNETNGRLGEGRQWQEGIHQAIEARESLPISAPSCHAAKLTVQNLFLSYRHMAGMTGTALAARSEFRRVYRKRVSRIPTHQECRRQSAGVSVFRRENEKWNAICDEVSRRHQTGQPVLIGTRTVEKSERLASLLSLKGLQYSILTAKQNADEAAIIERAGQRGSITVATGMAGRGTDIKLGDGVDQLGGLFVVLTELNDSPRMDRQLIGRCARQGDQGSYAVFLSLEDEIVRIAYGDLKAKHCQQSQRINQSILKQAQQMVEKRKFKQRTSFLYQEKRRLRALWHMGADPLLDAI